jgi:hypothetical protein
LYKTIAILSRAVYHRGWTIKIKIKMATDMLINIRVELNAQALVKDPIYLNRQFKAAEVGKAVTTTVTVGLVAWGI